VTTCTGKVSALKTKRKRKYCLVKRSALAF
jgi:hypothetical protein